MGPETFCDTIANLRDRIAEPEIPQHVHGVGADLDAGADLAELRRLLIDFDVVTGLQQARCGGKPAEPRAGNEYFLSNHFLLSAGACRRR
jgi:hypothetical protein